MIELHGSIHDLTIIINSSIFHRQQTPMTQAAMNKLVDGLVKEINKQLNSLKSYKEEQERLRKIQEQMEAEKKKREEEERKRNEEERMKKE